LRARTRSYASPRRRPLTRGTRLGGVSDNDGRYVIRGVPAGSYTDRRAIDVAVVDGRERQ